LRPDAGDVQFIAENLRHADIEEIRSVRGDADLLAVVRRSVEVSGEVWVAVSACGMPVALFGVAPTEQEHVGSPWLLGTDAVPKHRRELVVDGRKLVARWNRKYHTLFNLVDARHAHARRWLRHLGFVEHPEVKLGAGTVVPVVRIAPPGEASMEL
jgi:hypothetical protein